MRVSTVFVSILICQLRQPLVKGITMIHIEAIDEKSPHLEDVKRLWRSNSDWLGYYPEGAFLDRARRRQILVAIKDKACCGYLIYFRTERRKIRLTHLCVKDGHRGEGVARGLIDALRNSTKDDLGISLYCRRDFPTWGFWPKLGFVALDQKRGRGRDGAELTFYWLPITRRSCPACSTRAATIAWMSSWTPTSSMTWTTRPETGRKSRKASSPTGSGRWSGSASPRSFSTRSSVSPTPTEVRTVESGEGLRLPRMYRRGLSGRWNPRSVPSSASPRTTGMPPTSGRLPERSPRGHGIRHKGRIATRVCRGSLLEIRTERRPAIATGRAIRRVEERELLPARKARRHEDQ